MCFYLSFDSLIPATWFAIRIEYRLIYHTSDGGYSDFPTKQELIVRTKNDSQISPTHINDQIIFIEGVVTDERDVNVTVSSAFQATSRLSTLIVPELQCLRGIVKPPAQRVISLAKIHFDLRKNMRNTNRFDNPHCSKLCIFPFIRAEIIDIGQQTFRGKEWCGTVEEALDLISNNCLKTVIVSKILIIFAFFIVLNNVFRC
uniref:Uncharacterized protein n=1 Tax=Panagrolaimus sp. PS1159 TaxID=55785 RepID=A0AC35GK83_9BILA